jgi:hypothetical protein
MGQNNMKKGETVEAVQHLTANQTLLAPLVDSNQNARLVQSYERFILDSVTWSTDNDYSAGLLIRAGTGAGAVLWQVGALDGATSPDSFQNLFAEFPGEGIVFPVGLGPFFEGINADQTVVITGRIVTGTSQGVRAGYKELLTPGGNQSGQ